MIRVLHVVSSLNINAGMMSVIMNYYRNIDRSKLQFDFLYFKEMNKTHKEEIVKMGGRVFLIEESLSSLRLQKQLSLFFKKHRNEYVAVHCHPIWGSILVGRVAKKNGIKHVIQHSHSTQFSDKKTSAIRNRILLKYIHYFATDYIACSPEAANLFKRKTEDVFILNNAISLESYSFDKSLRNDIRKEFAIDEKTFVIGNIGRLCSQKNQLFLLDIFKEVNRIIPDSKLMIVGSGTLRDAIDEKTNVLKLHDSVIMTGRRTDVRALLSSFDLFLMPSLFEGAPVAAVEALASGLSCVVSDTITSMIKMDQVTYLSLHYTPKQWADVICQIPLNNNRNDQSAIALMGFDINREANKLIDYYCSLNN